LVALATLTIPYHPGIPIIAGSILIKIIHSYAYTLSAKIGLLTIRTISKRFDEGVKLADKLLAKTNKPLHNIQSRVFNVKKAITFQSFAPVFKSKY
jgi:hypothetical protein